MRHRFALAAAGIGLAAVASPYTPMSAQAHHCQALLIFSGYQVAAPTTPPPPSPVPAPPATPSASPNANPGAVGCLNDDEALNTNLLAPGANFLSVGSYPTPTAESYIDVDGVVTPLTFTLAADGSRWNSQRISLNQAKVATATVKTITGLTVSVTYTSTPSTEL